jgi:hypothetical protein
MPTIEAHLRREMHKYAAELRKLAYAVPNGVGEHDLLELSEVMNVAADETPRNTSTYAAAGTSPGSGGPSGSFTSRRRVVS